MRCTHIFRQSLPATTRKHIPSRLREPPAPYDALARAKIPRLDADGGKLDIHALRHTFASRLCRARVGLVHAQNLFGHSDPRLTAAIYVHGGPIPADFDGPRR